jgi:hypothetical protein
LCGHSFFGQVLSFFVVNILCVSIMARFISVISIVCFSFLFSELCLCVFGRQGIVSSCGQFRVLVSGVFFSSIQAREEFLDFLVWLPVLCLLCLEFSGNRSS